MLQVPGPVPGEGGWTLASVTAAPGASPLTVPPMRPPARQGPEPSTGPHPPHPLPQGCSPASQLPLQHHALHPCDCPPTGLGGWGGQGPAHGHGRGEAGRQTLIQLTSKPLLLADGMRRLRVWWRCGHLHPRQQPRKLSWATSFQTGLEGHTGSAPSHHSPRGSHVRPSAPEPKESPRPPPKNPGVAGGGCLLCTLSLHSS